MGFGWTVNVYLGKMILASHVDPSRVTSPAKEHSLQFSW